MGELYQESPTLHHLLIIEPDIEITSNTVDMGFRNPIGSGVFRVWMSERNVNARNFFVLQNIADDMAIAGVPATAWEMARVLEHSFQYFRRTQLQEMSVDGKVRALSKLLRDNFGFVLQGVGIVVPIFATYDSREEPSARLYFYDAMGAQFEVADYAATGSGSPAVRGILYYENNWGKKTLAKLDEDEAVTVALRALDTAAESDTATGGVDRNAKIFPVIKVVSRDGITTLPEKRIAALFKRSVA